MFLISDYIQSLVKRGKEIIDNPDTSSTAKYIIKIAIIITFAITGVVSAYLSWRCNSHMEYSLFEKVVYATGAAVFGFAYLFYYTLFRADICDHCGHLDTVQAA